MEVHIRYLLISKGTMWIMNLITSVYLPIYIHDYNLVYDLFICLVRRDSN